MAGEMQHSRCVQIDVLDMTKAVSIFSSKNADGTIPLVLIPSNRVSFSSTMFVPSGCNCLLQKCGKSQGLATPGLKWYAPWWRISHIVSRQSSTYNAPVQQCPTADNVMVHVDVTVVFAIRDPTEFVYNLGATKFDTFLAGAVEEGIRVLVRSQTHDEVYQLRGNRAGSLLQMLNEKFGDCGVSFSDCKITSVWLPDTLSRSLEKAKTCDIQIQGEQKRHEYEMMRIRQTFEEKIERINRQNEQLKVAEDGKIRIAEMEGEQQMSKGEAVMQEAVLKAESECNVKMADAKHNLDNAKVVFEKDKLVMIADAMREAQSLKAAAEFFKADETTKAHGALADFKAQAEQISLQADVEKASIVALSEQRKFDLAKREKEIIGNFAKKGDVKLLGTQGDTVINAVLDGKLARPGAQVM